MDKFFEQLEGELEEIREDLKNIRIINMTQDDWQYTALLINVGCAMDHLNRTSKATPKVYGKSVIMIT